MKKNFISLMLLALIVTSCDLGPSKCDCKENFWDPNNKKYGEVLVWENTGIYGGTNITKRKKMMNQFSNMVSFKDLSNEDKKLREKCLKKYPAHSEVMNTKCK